MQTNEFSTSTNNNLTSPGFTVPASSGFSFGATSNLKPLPNWTWYPINRTSDCDASVSYKEPPLVNKFGFAEGIGSSTGFSFGAGTGSNYGARHDFSFGVGTGANSGAGSGFSFGTGLGTNGFSSKNSVNDSNTEFNIMIRKLDAIQDTLHRLESKINKLEQQS